MSKQRNGIFYRFIHSIRDWNGTDIPLGATGVYILIRPSGNGKNGIRLSFSTIQKP